MTAEREAVLYLLRSHCHELVPDARDAWLLAADIIEKGLHHEWLRTEREALAALTPPEAPASTPTTEEET